MDEALEKAIDEVGRDRVFMRARSHGWDSHATPPKWVWWGIVNELRNDVPPPAPRQSDGGLLSLFGLSGLF